MSGIHVVIAGGRGSGITATIPESLVGFGNGLVQSGTATVTVTGGSGSWSAFWYSTDPNTEIVVVNAQSAYVQGYPPPGEPLVTTMRCDVTDTVTLETVTSNNCTVTLTGI